ncbi:sporulation YhaL family protein [Bacillus marinisedimentorum]|uniref:sporulation YhaL family protein n=1 Tax=Bacillus marinisedimentorum TaxID=1821260 RepID=UPI0007DEB078|nr:sporulation YhaL family protein [Bacillus marinisedimentorum]
MLLPWWIYLVLAGIAGSAFMLIKTLISEKKMEQYYIEKEGRVYLDRIKEEKERRKERSRHHQPG